MKSLKEVYQRHSAASKRAVKEGKGRLSQATLALTQFGFMGFSLLFPEKFGVIINDDDLEGFIHFWRTIGHLVGVQDR